MSMKSIFVDLCEFSYFPIDSLRYKEAIPKTCNEMLIDESNKLRPTDIEDLNLQLKNSCIINFSDYEEKVHK